MITCEGLTRKYDDFVAVKEVSFSIEKGEIVGLLGHNGAGKTTIMKTLTGYLEPTAGKVIVDDLEVLDNRLEVQKKIGYLPENCPVYGDMTVLDYLEYVCELRGIPADERNAAIRSVVETTHLEEKAVSLINTLSRGYRQRVGVAQAIIHKPEILILDEPTNGLDPSQIHDMRSLIKRLSENSTVILSTHILQEVQAICDRVIIILRGEVALDSKLADLQSSDRLALSVGGEKDEVQNTLKGVNGVTSVQLESDHDGVSEFSVQFKQNGHAVIPEIAKTMIEKGFELHALHPEKRDLDTVFREINQ
jgi:ABC-2 type transport system ATP-binding protein